jgi:UDP-N-acetylmuramoyl-tripeptide--D-alanyl-D-alanine ligase
MLMHLSEISRCIKGDHSGEDPVITKICIDTRNLQSGDLYLAIKGENFDGNDFLDKAEQKGAAAAVVERKIETQLPCVVVADTRKAMGDLAKYVREKLGIPVCGITGSNGKTTVKEMLATILGINAEVLFTQGNFNNDIGVPLTLLRLNEQHRYAVIEMGANHLGEISYLSGLVRPDVAVITNVGAAHIEGFGSIEGVAREKGEIVALLSESGIAVLNADDQYFNYWKNIAADRKIISFALNAAAEVTASRIKSGIKNNRFVTEFELMAAGKTMPIQIQLAGKHNVINALAACAASMALGIDLEQVRQGLKKMQPVTGRLQPLQGRLGNIVIDDTYNANPSSLKAALDVLLTCEGEPWVVIGAFGELGKDSKKAHEQMGEMIKSTRAARLLAIGSEAENMVRVFGKGATFFASQADLIDTLNSELKGHEAVLVKGSRTQRMEQVVAALVENFRK